MADLDEKQMVFDDDTRTDITFSNEDEIIIVELKKGAIDHGALNQLLHYLRKTSSIEKGKRKISGILVGASINDKIELLKNIKESGFDIKLKVYGKDVPTIIKFCEKCRRATSVSDTICRYDGCKKFFF